MELMTERLDRIGSSWKQSYLKYLFEITVKIAKFPYAWKKVVVSCHLFLF